jgi:hypothetical protein
LAFSDPLVRAGLTLNNRLGGPLLRYPDIGPLSAAAGLSASMGVMVCRLSQLSARLAGGFWCISWPGGGVTSGLGGVGDCHQTAG